MQEVESDEENQLTETEPKKTTYTKMTRLHHEPNETKKKAKLVKSGGDGEDEEGNNMNADEAEYEDDEEYYKKFMAETGQTHEEDEMDMLRMQLQYEKEEADRKAKVAAAGDGTSAGGSGGSGGGGSGVSGGGDNEQKKTRVDEDGTVYEWDPVVKGYFPKIGLNKLIEYQQAYKAPTSSNPYENLREGKAYLINGVFFKWDTAGQKWISLDQPVYEYIDYVTQVEHEWSQEENKWKAKSTPTATSTQTSSEEEKRLAAESLQKQSDAVKKPATASTTKKEGWFEIDDGKNTNVYVSGLPLDITDQEFEKMMSKYGGIMKDPVTHKPKCKLYKENNEAKGDGRCCYLMPESVSLCIQMLDGSEYRGKIIKVEKAKFELKGTYDPSKAGATGEKKVKLNKNKEKKLIEKQRKKLLDWEERPEVVRYKHEKVVVIKNIFTMEDVEKDRLFVNKFRDDLKTELEQYGEIKKILVHERHPEGIVTVSFREIDDADRCCEYLDNRVWKNGRIISCATWDGETKFDQEETEEERSKRLNEWQKFLESDD